MKNTKKIIIGLLLLLILGLSASIFYINHQVNKYLDNTEQLLQSPYYVKMGFKDTDIQRTSNVITTQTNITTKFNCLDYVYASLKEAGKDLSSVDNPDLKKIIATLDGYTLIITSKLSSLNIPLIGKFNVENQFSILKNGKPDNAISQEVQTWFSELSSVAGHVGFNGFNYTSKTTKPLKTTINNETLTISPITYTGYFSYDNTHFTLDTIDGFDMNLHTKFGDIDIEKIKLGHNIKLNKALSTIYNLDFTAENIEKTISTILEALNKININISVGHIKTNMNKSLTNEQNTEAHDAKFGFTIDFSNNKFNTNSILSVQDLILNNKEKTHFNLDISFASDSWDKLKKFYTTLEKYKYDIKVNKAEDEAVFYDLLTSNPTFTINNFTLDTKNTKLDTQIDLNGTIKIDSNKLDKSKELNDLLLKNAINLQLDVKADPALTKHFIGLDFSEILINKHKYNVNEKNKIQFKDGKLSINDTEFSFF